MERVFRTNVLFFTEELSNNFDVVASQAGHTPEDEQGRYYGLLALLLGTRRLLVPLLLLRGGGCVW